MAIPTIHVFHIPEEHVDFVRKFGMTPVERDSWRKDTLHKVALKDLLLVHEDISYRTGSLESQYLQNSIPSQDQTEAELYTYFFKAFDWILREVQRGVKGKNIHPCRIVLNFMPFTFPTSVVDKIIRGLIESVNQSKKKTRWKIHIQFLTRNASSFKGSTFFQIAVKEYAKHLKFSLIDYRGYRFENLSPTFRMISRDMFHRAMKINDATLYKRLIYQTNAYIGHFALPHSHVRTHYDLKEFVNKDCVFEHLFAEITSLIESHCNVAIVLLGIETVALTLLAERLSRYRDEFTQRINYDDIGSREIELLKQADCILLLADILNTGRSMKDAKDKLAGLVSRETPVISYALAKMSNTPDVDVKLDCSTAIVIKRPYYNSDPTKCLLCQIGQPLKEVKISADFSYLDESQLTPYDFWEMIHECKALKQSENDPRGRVLGFRVETGDVFKRYGSWLQNVVAWKYERILPARRPTILLTVHEAGGLAFARLVRDALKLETNCIVSVSRKDLEINVLSPAQTAQDRKFTTERVLIVDDGINDGGTMKLLTRYCGLQGADPIGAIVFDSRLTEAQSEPIRSLMGRVPIIVLYRWPGEVVKYNKTFSV